MNLAKYIERASNGARVQHRTIPGKPIVAHTWRATVNGEPGWEYVLADYHGNLLAQVWSRGGTIDRDKDITETIEKLLDRVSKAAS